VYLTILTHHSSFPDEISTIFMIVFNTSKSPSMQGKKAYSAAKLRFLLVIHMCPKQNK